MFGLILVSICIVCAVVGQIAMKSGMGDIGEISNMRQLLNSHTLFLIFTNIRILIGLLFYAVSAVLWLAALSTLNVSFMYPLLSLAYVVTAILAFVFLKEKITPFGWLGIILVVGGCFLILKAGR
ncbi:MAG: EamA family transporter [Dehalococcoidales bacterium]